MTTKHKQRNGYLLIISIVFIIGTLIDIATKYLYNFAIGGLGAAFAAITGIILMYRYRRDRFSWKTLFRMLRFSWPHFTSFVDVLFVLLVVIATAATLCFISSGVSHPVITPALLLYGLSAAILPPAIEEFLDRGFIQSALEGMRFPSTIVVGASAIIFSLSHIPVNTAVVPLAFVAGLCFGVITMRTRSIVLPFVIHGLWNLSIVLFVS